MEQDPHALSISDERANELYDKPIDLELLFSDGSELSRAGELLVRATDGLGTVCALIELEGVTRGTVAQRQFYLAPSAVDAVQPKSPGGRLFLRASVSGDEREAILLAAGGA